MRGCIDVRLKVEYLDSEAIESDDTAARSGWCFGPWRVW